MRRLLATTLLATGAFAALTGQSEAPAHASATALSVDTEITGNDDQTVGTINECRQVSGSAQFEVDVVIQDGPSLSGFEADVFYDPAIVTVSSADPRFILDGGFFFDLSDPTPDTDGRYHIVIATTGNGTGSGAVVRMTLQTLGSGISPLDLANVKMKDFDNNYVQPADGSGFFTGPTSDGRVAVDTSCSSDLDGDGVQDDDDNCPLWPNPLQNLPPWSIPANDPDCDGFSSTDESYITTLWASPCPSSSAANDDDPDAWPPDFDDTKNVNVTDVLALKPVFSQTVPPVSTRYDLAPSGAINVSDVLKIKPFFALSCTP